MNNGLNPTKVLVNIVTNIVPINIFFFNTLSTSIHGSALCFSSYLSTAQILPLDAH